MVHQQIVGILMGTNGDPFIANLFLFCCERDFMSNIQNSKQYDLIEIFNDTSRDLDDIFTIDTPGFEKHIPDIHLTELQLKKQILQTNKLLFLIQKLLVMFILAIINYKRHDFGFPIVYFPSSR